MGFRPLRAVALTVVGLLIWLSGLNLDAWGPWMFGVALLVGLPHGALDHVLARHWRGWRGGWGQVRFHVAYLASMVGILVAWFFAPSAALTVFLLSAVWHFGETDVLHVTQRGSRLALVVSRGFLVVIAPLHAHPEVSLQLLTAVTGTDAARTLPLVFFGGFQFAWSVWAVHIAVLAVVLGWGERFVQNALEATALAILVIAGGPLVGFPLYFVFWHTPDHLMAAARASSMSFRQVAWAVCPRTLGGLAVIGLLLLTLDSSLWAMATVWAISALTLPHAFIVHYGLGTPIETREKRVRRTRLTA